jgi:hypothetical protein
MGQAGQFQVRTVGPEGPEVFVSGIWKVVELFVCLFACSTFVLGLWRKSHRLTACFLCDG